MTSMMERNLTAEIDAYLQFIGEPTPKGKEKTEKSREKIIRLLAEDGKMSAVALAERLGISAKAVEKHLARLKADGVIERIGPAKGGYWKVK
jgi:predicted HTH transcriptional regulator